MSALVRRVPPAWIQDIVRACGPALEREVGRLDSAALGCGADGCVLPVSGRADWVVKVTADGPEGRLAEKIVRMRASGSALPGIVEIAGVWIVRRTGRQAVYVIIREPVRPFYAGGRFDVPPSVASATTSARLVSTVEARVTHLLDRRYGPADVDRFSAGAPVLEAVASTLRVLLREGIQLPDLHVGNLSWSLRARESRPANTLIVHDFGRARGVSRGAVSLRKLRCGA